MIRTVLWVALGAPLWAQSAAETVLAAKCLGCHGAARMSDLDLRDRASALRGGKRGPALVPGDAARSLLVQAVEGAGPVKMPPGNARLTGDEIKSLRDWVAAGAPWGQAPAPANTWWSFRKPIRPATPAVKNAGWVRNPVDAFVLAKMEAAGVQPAPEASRLALVRRAFFDLHGLPPTPEQAEAFVNDSSPGAYRKLVDGLLESPRYGERWGRYWLDLVRYADTAGFETDHFFTGAWRYRDYVIQSLNADKPYDVFIKEQIAADEIWPTNLDLEGTMKLPKEKQENLRRRIATGLFTIGSFPIEYTYYGDQYRAEWQADAVDTVGAAFLGMTMGCARCHDHKFDAISQRDYYRLTAIFAGSVEREIPLGSLFDVQTASRGFPLLAQAEAYKQMARAAKGAQRTELLAKLGEAYLRAPDRMATATVLAHEETAPPASYILAKGDFKAKGERVEPGFPAAILAAPPIAEPEGSGFVPRRRRALAEWLTSPEQPLTARVMVNRIWQGHFGDGIVRSPNDFGRQGDAPTHPELLDWLATEFAGRGWSMKQMHRLIMMSNTYRQASGENAQDPENRTFSRMRRLRLDGDAIRDSMLAVAGELNLKMGGVGIIPPLTKEEMQAARMPNLWPAHPNPAEHNRRSVYLQMKRSLTLPMLQIFDAPDTAVSCARRERSTVAPQALALLNSEFAAAQADRFAGRVRAAAGAGASPEALVRAAWRIAFNRAPDAAEMAVAQEYLGRNNLSRLCLMIFNLNEFVYVD
ncbi:MAG: PSD1 domain-containing protein [Bryobacterales bacterium]|nr:PSD1 domain-containing protein [Bryobacterales bacterium]